MNPLRTAAAVGLLCITPALPLHAEGASPAWEAAFPVGAAPTHVHFRARYLDGRGQSHSLEVWRDGAQRLRRKTDKAVDLYIARDAAGEPDYRIVDHARGVVIRADRMTFYRIGRFSDWLGLAHVMDVPRGAYTVAALPKPPESKPAGQCAWFRLAVTVPSRNVSDVCWSTQWGLPLEIRLVGANGDPSAAQFSVETVNVFQPTDAIFAVGDGKLLNVDARPDDDLSD